MEQARKDQSAIGTVLWPALRVGTLSGVSGFVFGAVTGLIRSSSPALFGILAAAQWFGLGSTFWGLRSLGMRYWSTEHPPVKEKVLVSSVAGGCTGGGLGFLMRGRANVIPGAIVFSMLGAGTQGLFSWANGEISRDSTPSTQRSSMLQEIAKSKWVPMKVLTDEEYAAMLDDKLLRVDAHLAAVDDELRELQATPKKTNEDSALSSKAEGK